MATKLRTCKRCNVPLGDQAYKCAQCGQLNPTPAFWAALILATPPAVLAGIFVFMLFT